MALDPTLDTALQSPVLRVFHAVQIILPSGNLNLIDGSGFVSFDVFGTTTTFIAKDAVYGTLSTIGQIEESIATSSPTCKITILPPTPDAIGNLSDPTYQGSLVFVWFGVVDEATGATVGLPALIWTGRLDVAVTTEAQASRGTELTTISAFDRLFIVAEGAVLNDSFHQSIWPGETGLLWNIAALAEPTWGGSAPSPITTPQTPVGPSFPGAGTPRLGPFGGPFI